MVPQGPCSVWGSTWPRGGGRAGFKVPRASAQCEHPRGAHRVKPVFRPACVGHGRAGPLLIALPTTTRAKSIPLTVTEKALVVAPLAIPMVGKLGRQETEAGGRVSVRDRSLGATFLAAAETESWGELNESVSEGARRSAMRLQLQLHQQSAGIRESHHCHEGPILPG